MADEPKRPMWLSKDTLLPWSAAVAFAALSWYGATQFGGLRLTIQEASTKAARDTSDQAHALEIQIISLRSTVEIQGRDIASQGRDLAAMKESVERLDRSGSK